MYVYRFSGKTCCIVFRVLGSLKSMDKRKLVTSWGDTGTEIWRGPGPAERAVDWHGNGGRKIQGTGTAEPLGASSPLSPGGKGRGRAEMEAESQPVRGSERSPRAMVFQQNRSSDSDNCESRSLESFRMGRTEESSQPCPRSDRVYFASRDKC